MRQILFMLIIFQIISTASSQNYLEAKYFHYYDQIIIDSLVLERGITRYLIYQTMLKEDSIIRGEDEDKIVSFLIWQEKNNICVKLISKNHIYNTLIISNSNFFNYKYFNLLWAEKNEDRLLFVPPFLSPYNSEIILFVNRTKKYFYELGTLHYYIENKEKSMFRKNFMMTIKKEVLSIIKRFKIEHVYQRL